MASGSIDRDELIRILEDESVYRRKVQKNINVVLISILTISFASFGYLIAVKGDTSGIVYLGCLIAVGGVGAGMRPAHKQAIADAAKQMDGQTSAYLCELLDNQEIMMKNLVEETLAISLPKLRVEDAKHFSDYQIAGLAQALLLTKNGSFAEAAVHALGCVGKLNAIDALQSAVEKKMTIADPATKDRVSTRSSMALADIRMREAKIRIDAALPNQQPELYNVRIFEST
jgi:hypothetical protein